MPVSFDCYAVAVPGRLSAAKPLGYSLGGGIACGWTPGPPVLDVPQGGLERSRVTTNCGPMVGCKVVLENQDLEDDPGAALDAAKDEPGFRPEIETREITSPPCVQAAEAIGRWVGI